MNDPLLSGVPLGHEAMFYPNGFPTRIRSNCLSTLEAAQKSWGKYRRRYDLPPLEIRLAVLASDSPGCFEPPVFRSQGHLVSIVADPENFACLDLDGGFAFGWVTEATAGNQDYFRECLLDVLICPLLETRQVSEEDGLRKLSSSAEAVEAPEFEDRLAALERLLSIPDEMRYAAIHPAIDLVEPIVDEQLD